MAATNPFPDVARRNLTMQYIELPMVLLMFKVRRDARILDLGCGRGFGVSALRDHGYRNVIGVDIDTSATLQSAVAHDGTIICGDACEMPVASSSVDVIFDFGTSYHVMRPGASLAEIQRVLRTGGRYIYETRASQLLSHPVRSRGKVLPWDAAPRLTPERHALLWACRIKR